MIRIENCHGAKFSIAVSLLYQLSWKLCEYLYICTWALLHCCQIVVISMPSYMFCIHLCEGTSLLQSSVSVLKCFVMDVEFCEVDIIASIPPQQPCHFHYRNCIRNKCLYICIHVRHFDCDCTATQHSHTSLGSITSRNLVKLQHFQLAPLVLNSVTVSNQLTV
jgi:hypothetical protein